MQQVYEEIQQFLGHKGVQLVAVSKTKSEKEILKLYDLGQRDFGENRVVELDAKRKNLPGDIRWHMIGHLQRNKVKVIAEYVHMIHGVDSRRLLETINREAQKLDKIQKVLLQIKIAQEESKYGLDPSEATIILNEVAQGDYPHINIEGFMGMATFTDDKDQIREEFKFLKEFQTKMLEQFEVQRLNLTQVSMGMSGDFDIAVEEGSTIVRIGSLLFGPRN